MQINARYFLNVIDSCQTDGDNDDATFRNGQCKGFAMRAMNLRTKVVVSTALAFMGGNVASAQQFPRFDITHYCEKIARSRNANRATLKGQCIKQEQAAYSALNTSWTMHPPQVLGECISITAPVGSYSALLACIQQDMKARSKAR